jgi:hypothetical protein
MATKNNPAGEPVRPTRKRVALIRYSARTITGAGGIAEITIGADLKRVLARARSHHRRSGQPTWVWNVRTGESVYQIGEVSIHAACA